MQGSKWHCAKWVNIFTACDKIHSTVVQLKDLFKSKRRVLSKNVYQFPRALFFFFQQGMDGDIFP